MKKLLLILAIVMTLPVAAYASEVEGTLTTGVQTGVEGTVIVAPTASPVAGTYTSAQSATLTAAGSSSIRYTTDGSTPTCSVGTPYSGAISVGSSLTLKAIACYSSNTASTISSNSYTINISSGGGGGGTTPAIPATPAVPTVTPAIPATPAVPARGRVLGAAAYNFTKALAVGVRSDEVTELQKALIAEGLLKIDAPTGYFGALTRTAVIAFQKARGIANTGFVGPLTRAELNKGAVVSTVAAGKTNLTTSQADAILSLIESFGADASVIAKVKASLGL